MPATFCTDCDYCGEIRICHNHHGGTCCSTCCTDECNPTSSDPEPTEADWADYCEWLDRVAPVSDPESSSTL